MGELLVVIMVHLENALARFEGPQGPPCSDVNNFQVSHPHASQLLKYNAAWRLLSDLSVLLDECCALMNDVLVHAVCRWDKPSGYIAMTKQITDTTLFNDSVIQSAQL